MSQEKLTNNKQQSPLPPVKSSSKATKGYPAVTRFVQPSNGLPVQLKHGVEGLSGLPMDDIQVHYNSSAPARIGALAYAAGNQIHLGPGQEQHLPHEAWHVVQQKQGRVKPTLQAKGLAINDDNALETEADVMGQRAVQLKTTGDMPIALPNLSASQPSDVIQRKIGFEFQAVNSIFLTNIEKGKQKLGVNKGRFDVESDGGVSRLPELELVTIAVDETSEGRDQLVDIMGNITWFLRWVNHDSVVGLQSENVRWVDYIVEKRNRHSDLLKKFYFENLTETEETKKEEEKRVARKKRFDAETADVPKYVIPNGVKHFHPQATVGVKFENVFNLIEHLTNAPIKNRGINKRKKDRAVTKPAESEIKASTKETKDVAMPTGGDAVPGEAKTELIQKVVPDTIRKRQEAADIIGWGAKKYHTTYRKACRAALTKVKKIPGLSPKVKGLATIFLGLVEALDKKHEKTVEKAKLVKYLMPFMLRTGFMPFFNSLNAVEKEQLKRIKNEDFDRKINQVKLTIKDIFEDMVGIQTNIKGGDYSEDDNDQDDDDYSEDDNDHQDYKDDDGYISDDDDYSEDDNVQNDHSNYDEEKREDFLQKRGISGHGKIKDDEASMDPYNMKDITDIGISDSEKTRRKGAVIELRKLGNEVPAEKLTEFALAVFDLTVLINGPEDSSSSSSSSSPLSTPPPSLSSSS